MISVSLSQHVCQEWFHSRAWGEENLGWGSGLWTHPGSQLGAVSRLGYLGADICTLDQGRPGVSQRARMAIEVNLKDKEGQTGKFRVGRPERSTDVQGGGALFMKSWGPVSGGSCRKASPVMTEATTPKSRGVFAPAERSVMRTEKAFPRRSGLCRGRCRWWPPFSP